MHAYLSSTRFVLLRRVDSALQVVTLVAAAEIVHRVFRVRRLPIWVALVPVGAAILYLV
jgi:hypothetical protein